MTARWSGVVRGSAAPRASALQKAISMSNVGGFPTALGGQSPEVMFRHGCSWRETSVVETDSRHLGAATEGWLQGRTRRRVERRRRPVTRNGVHGHCPPQKGAPGKQRSKGRRRPLGDGSAKTSWSVFEPKSNSWKARGVLSFRER
jgi:hypothetical protein